jgi:hypothetical protein
VGFLERVFGRPEERSEADRPGDRSRETSADEQAIERYRYLLRTAPPEAVEEAHAEAFARLTPEQRSEVLRRFGESLPSSELGEARSGDPRALARAATRAEVRDPGFLERTLGRGGMGMGGGLGGVFGTSLLGSLAGTFLGTAIASHFLHGGGPSVEGLAADESEPADQEYSQADLDSGPDLDGGDLDDIDV